MTREKYYRRMFYAAAVFNWIAAATTAFGAPAIRSAFGIISPFNAIGGETFAVFAALFGYGYYIVGRDTTRNEGIVTLGIIGKLAMFGLLMGNAIAGRIQYSIAMMTLGDMIFAALFIEFMVNGRALAYAGERDATAEKSLRVGTSLRSG